MINTHKALPRRTVLRGLGASLALPLLDGMVPAFAAIRNTAAAPVKRLGIVYVPNGVDRDRFARVDSARVQHLRHRLRLKCHLKLAPHRRNRH